MYIGRGHQRSRGGGDATVFNQVVVVVVDRPPRRIESVNSRTCDKVRPLRERSSFSIRQVGLAIRMVQ